MGSDRASVTTGGRTTGAGTKLNQSVRKAIAILRAASSQVAGETASGLARGAGLPWATAVRLIRTLEEDGFLCRLPDTDRYVIGYDLILLARRGDQGNLLAAIALPALERLAEAVGETVNLTVVRPDGRPEVVEQIDPPRLIRTTDSVGGPYPLHATSIGKLLLAAYDDARLAEFLSEPLARYAGGTITDPPALREELARTRARGYSSAVDELEDGLAALSAGVRDAGGELVAMVTVSGPSFRFDGAARTAALEPMRDAVKAIERYLSCGRVAAATARVVRGAAGRG